MVSVRVRGAGGGESVWTLTDQEVLLIELSNAVIHPSVHGDG